MAVLREFQVGGFRISEHDTLDSTNNYLKHLAAIGEPDGAAAVALTQSAGKGRLGRSFFSPGESGLYMSVLLRREIPLGLSHLLTPLAAVAVADALADCGAENVGIKWVNDLYLDGRKVCGILTETGVTPDGSTLDWAVIGIGVNLFEPNGGFPDDIKNRAGATFKKYDSTLRDRLIKAILNNLDMQLSGLLDRRFLDSYRERSILIGREIEIVAPEGNVSARAVAIDDDCRLLVDTADGSRSLFTGEVSIKI